jgi:hypothetical protein
VDAELPILIAAADEDRVILQSGVPPDKLN